MPFLDALSRLAFGFVASQSETPRLSPLDIAWSERGDSTANERDRLYQLYQWYYEGAHRDPRDEDFSDAAIPTTQPTFSARHNFMSVVVDVAVERLNVTGFTVEGASADALLTDPASAPDARADTETAARLWRWWQANRMDETQRTVHAQALIKGDAYLLVYYDQAAGRPCFMFNDALQITPVYDADHHMTAAYKAWVERYADGNQVRLRYRINKYTPGFIEKFSRDDRGGAWKLWTDDLDAAGTPDGGVIVWQDAAGNPLGIPIVHFRNKPRGDDFGRSDLDDLIPAQDVYNDRHWQTSQAMRYQGSPQRYVTGAMPPKDGWTNGPHQIWAIAPLASDKPVTVGQFAAGNVAELQDATDRQLKTIAAMSRTPLHLLWPEGALPSGESLKSAEAGLIAKCQDRSITFGNAWEDALRLALRLQNTFSTEAPLPEDVTISAQWGPFEMRSELSDEQVTALMASDLSWRERMRRRGYTEESIDKIRAEKDAEPQPAPATASALVNQLAPLTAGAVAGGSQRNGG